MRENVIDSLERLASGLGKQDLEITYSYYAIAHNELDSQKERDAFRYASLAMLADVGGMRFRRAYYDYRMKLAFKKLEEAECNGE